ncbi:hypothetical protein HHK36_026648 [Tetracentron sinense]|uniref:Fe2OG dioxygenase domain-containing protein n=1 Tax=Tetracentron sinense TaxID=13715 RepID=A0A834YL07_TETSI|nr:hypothetical protein HHK36_026648 [Tetracentron sinense]
MPPAAVPSPPSDRAPMGSGIAMQSPIPETFAKDAIIAWFRGEFAAANAIIDALCNHLTQLDGIGDNGSEYESVFGAIHRRRLNWIPILHMQKYYSIADVAVELRRVAGKKMKKSEEVTVLLKEEEDSTDAKDEAHDEKEATVDELKESDGDGSNEVVEEDLPRVDDSSDRKVFEKTGLSLKLPLVNVVKGLKLYEDIFIDSELSKLTNFVNDLRLAGRNGDLSGETFILFNQQLKGNKRELIQLGVPIFGQINEEGTNKPQNSNIEPIPLVLQAVIDHLVQWHLIQESRKPNSCIINFFDEGECSQPYLKPPHLDQPISTLLLSESTMAFGRALVSDHHGNFKGPLMLSLKEGSLLVMRGNSADMARHVMCPSSNKRVSITFFKVRPDTNQIQSPTLPPLTRAMTVWQPGVPNPYTMPNGAETMEVIPKWGVLRAPLVMLAPVRPMVMSPRKIPRGGTGVFLPWTVGHKKPAKHLPPRAQRGRLLALPSPIEAQVVEST